MRGRRYGLFADYFLLMRTPARLAVPFVHEITDGGGAASIWGRPAVKTRKHERANVVIELYLLLPWSSEPPTNGFVELNDSPM